MQKRQTSGEPEGSLGQYPAAPNSAGSLESLEISAGVNTLITESSNAEAASVVAESSLRLGQHFAVSKLFSMNQCLLDVEGRMLVARVDAICHNDSSLAFASSQDFVRNSVIDQGQLRNTFC